MCIRDRLTADPRMVSKAFTIPKLSYVEAMEMSHFGAKVIYPPTIKPAMDLGIPIYIKNTFNPAFAGSMITKEKVKHSHPVTGISSISNVSLLTLQGSGSVSYTHLREGLFCLMEIELIEPVLFVSSDQDAPQNFYTALLEIISG